MNRNDYRTWNETQVSQDARDTFARLTFNGVPVSRLVDSATGEPVKPLYMDFSFASKRVGLQLVEADIVYDYDAEGNQILKDDGQPVIRSTTAPEHDIAITVKVVGFADSFGAAIPKGKQYFRLLNEPTNRPLSSEHAAKLAKRLVTWMLTGEPLIQDSEGNGQNEQHRCTAVIYASLIGLPMPSEGIPIITLDGVSPGAAGAIDTGKQKSTADDFGSDPNLLPEPMVRIDYTATTPVGPGSEAKQIRAKILREMQGVCKRVLLRMIGSNIKASKFDGYESSGNAMLIAERWKGLDNAVNAAYAFLTAIPLNVEKRRVRPSNVWEVATAFALWSLRESPQLGSVTDLTDYAFPVIEDEDIDQFVQFLVDLEAGSISGTGPLATWCQDRVTAGVLRMKDESSFAQVCMALSAYMEGVEVSKDINRADKSGDKVQNGKVYFSFGGGDRGPLPPKPKKSKDE